MKKFILVMVLVLVACSLTFAADYVGAKKCKMCHKSEKRGKVFGKWLAGPHVNAFETLKKKGEEKNPKCLECHVTAFNTGGYKLADANASKFEGVQCEVCHGAGSDYKKMSVMKDQKQSIAKGLLIPSEAMCKKCHNKKSPTFKGFNYKEYLKKIDHTYRTK